MFSGALNHFHPTGGTLETKEMDDIANAVVQKLHERGHEPGMESEEHATHHAWVRMKIEQERRHDEMIEKVKATVVGGLALGFLAILARIGKIVIENWNTTPR